MRLSLEIVPYSYQRTLDELELICTKYDYFDTINIPDIKRLNTNCLKTVEIIKTQHQKFSIIPHIVAGNYHQNNIHELLAYIGQLKLTEILIIQGDYTQKDGFSTFKLTELLSRKLPKLKLYGAIDPYRQDIEQEIEYTRQKKALGITGFFTQPFFDLSLFQKYFNQLKNEDIFWGISPVTTKQSYKYWVIQNNAIFNQNFTPSLEWNVDFYHKTKKIIENFQSHHLYLMPIRINIDNYLNHIFSYSHV